MSIKRLSCEEATLSKYITPEIKECRINFVSKNETHILDDTSKIPLMNQILEAVDNYRKYMPQKKMAMKIMTRGSILHMKITPISGAA
tara:strand:+ start:1105 stop:1368 length:264 start_codon:yes stop_codon:yes gene_type:complete